MTKRTLTSLDLQNPKEGSILFLDKIKGKTKYIAFDDGIFRIWSDKSSFETKTRNIDRAIEKYNAILK